jgi:hypothetical protein
MTNAIFRKKYSYVLDTKVQACAFIATVAQVLLIPGKYKHTLLMT